MKDKQQCEDCGRWSTKVNIVKPKEDDFFFSSKFKRPKMLCKSCRRKQ